MWVIYCKVTVGDVCSSLPLFSNCNIWRDAWICLVLRKLGFKFWCYNYTYKWGILTFLQNINSTKSPQNSDDHQQEFAAGLNTKLNLQNRLYRLYCQQKSSSYTLQQLELVCMVPTYSLRTGSLIFPHLLQGLALIYRKIKRFHFLSVPSRI